jgi:hypothetical protein
MVEQLPEHELTCGSEPGWERGEGEAVAEQQPPRAPSRRAKCRSGFVTLPPVQLQELTTMILLLEGVLVSWSLAIDERTGLESYG